MYFFVLEQKGLSIKNNYIADKCMWQKQKNMPGYMENKRIENRLKSFESILSLHTEFKVGIGVWKPGCKWDKIVCLLQKYWERVLKYHIKITF